MSAMSGQRLLLVLGIVLLCSVSLAADRPTCAVLTFDAGEGITSGQARFLSDRFAALLTQSGKYDVVARSKMAEILRAAEFNRGDHCSATDCAVEAGQTLQVQYMIFGNVGRFDRLISLTTSLVDVQTGKILKTAVTDHEGIMTEFGKSAPAQNVSVLTGERNGSTMQSKRPNKLSGAAVLDVGGATTNALIVSDRLYSEIVETILRLYPTPVSLDTRGRPDVTKLLSQLDPYSYLLTPDNATEFTTDTGGLGFCVGKKNRRLVVAGVTEDSNAFGNLQSGESILQIDGISTRDMSIDDVFHRLIGPIASSVTLVVQNPDSLQPRELTIQRERSEVASVKSAKLLRDDIAYLRITQFVMETPAAVESSLRSFADQGMRALIIDLRSNAVGLLNCWVDVASMFLRRGMQVVYAQARDAEYRFERSVERSGRYCGLPVAVLVNRGTHGASEVLAAALQAHGAALVVGECTYGNGSGSSVISLQDNRYALRLTTHYYLTPKGERFDNVGVRPNLMVKMSQNDTYALRGEWETDLQMQAALRLLLEELD